MDGNLMSCRSIGTMWIPLMAAEEPTKYDDPGINIPNPDFPVPLPTIPPTSDCPFLPVGRLGMEVRAETLMDDCSDDKLFNIFTNGLGLDLESTGRFKLVVETTNRCGSFLSSMEWNPSNSFRTLLFLWLRNNNGTLHYYADVCNSTTIVAHKLGFNRGIDYVNTNCWRLNMVKGKVNLEYCKLVEVFDKLAPKKGGAHTLN